MTKWTPPDEIWISEPSQYERSWGEYDTGANVEYLLATPARKAADELVEALDNLISAIVKFNKTQPDQEPSPAVVRYLLSMNAAKQTLAKAQEES